MLVEKGYATKIHCSAFSGAECGRKVPRDGCMPESIHPKSRRKKKQRAERTNMKKMKQKYVVYTYFEWNDVTSVGQSYVRSRTNRTETPFMLCSMHVHDHGVSNGNVLHADTHVFSISLPSNYIRKMADDGYEILFLAIPFLWNGKIQQTQ